MEHQIEPIFIRMSNLPKVVGLSRAEIYRRVKLGTFPKPTSMGTRAVGWYMQTLKDWAAALDAH